MKRNILRYFNSYVTSEQFFYEAQQFANRVEPQVKYASFNPYWDYSFSYRDLSPRQKKWYFYWRAEVRAGNYLSSDIGYVLLHANEALNLVGFESVTAAYERLVNLWTHYRTIAIPNDQQGYAAAIWDQRGFLTVPIHPIDLYLIDWIADFIYIHKLQVSIIDWYTSAVSQGAILSDIHLYVGVWIRSNKTLEEMPVDALFALADYYPRRNKFYDVFHSKFNLDLVYKRAAEAIFNAILQKSKGKMSIFPLIRRPYTVSRSPFEKSLCKHSQQYISVVEIPFRLNTKRLSTQLTGIIKYVENIFRERANFRSKLRDIQIDSSWKTVIDKTFEIQPTPIKIDFQRAFEIANTSDLVRNRLITDGDDNLHDIEQTLHTHQLPLALETSQAEPAEHPILNPNWQSVLSTLRDHNWQVQADILRNIVEAQFVNVIIDEINDWALSLFGDVLIIQTPEGYLIVEDFRSEITALLI
jgi:hypothetical protein